MVKEIYQPKYLIKLYMRLFGYYGLATYWNTIYYKDKIVSSGLRRHEHKHIEQMARDGKFIYFIKYNYYWITKGYKNNPYEIEARKAEYEF